MVWFTDHVIKLQVGFNLFDKENAMSKKMFGAVLSIATLMILSVQIFAEEPQDNEKAGAVYATTNSAAGNSVVIFDRDDGGMLNKAGSIATGGMGAGIALDPLGSQGSLMLSENHRWLLSVNAGSNDVSVFRVKHDGLKLTDKVGSGGVFPISVTIFQNLVYVLNAVGSPNISGFNIDCNGKLTVLPYSTRSLGSGGFAQVGFSPDGGKLVVTDKTDSKILVFSVENTGLPSINPVTSTSNGATPFGLFFDQWDHLLVVEATTNAVSLYKIIANNGLEVISGSVANGQKAACWITGSESGEFFTANPGTSSISTYGIRKGKLVLLNPVAGTGSTPLDISITRDGMFLYALDPRAGSVDEFKIEHHGNLTKLGAVAGGLSIFAQGIAAR